MLFLPKAIPSSECLLAKNAILSKNKNASERDSKFSTNGRSVFYNPESPELVAFSRIVDSIARPFLKQPAYPCDGMWALYPAGAMMDEHVDVTPGAPLSLKFGVLTYVSEKGEFGGGEINFPEWGLSIRPNAGDLLIYDTATDLHSVSMVTEGTRISFGVCYTDIRENVIYDIYD
jgi:hypothetical protein